MHNVAVKVTMQRRTRSTVGSMMATAANVNATARSLSTTTSMRTSITRAGTRQSTVVARSGAAPAASANPLITTLSSPSLVPSKSTTPHHHLFSTTTPARSGGGAPHYDPPTGWLFGVKPGEKYQNEGWEPIFIWGMFGGFAMLAVAYAFKPDTSIQTWALEEARRRLEAEGILKEPDSEEAK